MNTIIKSTGKAPRSLVPKSFPKLPTKARRPKHKPAAAPPLEPAVINIPAAVDYSPEEEDFCPDPNAVPALSAMDAAESPLTRAQRTALVALAGGMSQIESANEAGVSRWTLHRWLREDADFQAAYNAWQQDTLVTAQNELRAIMQDAVDAVRDAIEHRSDANLAWKLLQSQGATTPPRPGSANVVELRRTQTLERRRKEIGLRKEEADADINELLTRKPEEFPNSDDNHDENGQSH